MSQHSPIQVNRTAKQRWVNRVLWAIAVVLLVGSVIWTLVVTRQ
jgi:hypothetical protein